MAEIVALIIEDDEHIAEVLKTSVASLGHRWRHAVTLEDVRKEVEQGGYDYVLLDMQIPANARAHESVACGETALRWLRHAAPERNAAGKHILQIIVVSAYSREPEFVSRMYEMEADGFIAKPFGSNDVVLDKIRDALARAGREDYVTSGSKAGHGSVAPPKAPSLPPEQASEATPRVRLRIDGSSFGGRTNLEINGVVTSLQDAFFTVLLYLVAGALRSRGTWMPAEKTGVSQNYRAPSRIRADLRALLPAGFEIIETQRLVGFRLNPEVVIAEVNWEALQQHVQPAIRKIAAGVRR